MGEKISKLTSRQRKSIRTKEKIYRTAIKMLAKYDFDSLTVRNICDEAGVSTGTFYHYFESKEDLWVYYLDDGLEKYAEKHPIRYEGDIAAYILQVYEIYLNYCQETGLEFLSHYYSTTNKQLSRTYKGADTRPVSRWIRDGIEKAKTEGTFSASISTDELIHDVCVIIKGCIFEWCTSDGSFQLGEYSKQLLTRYMSSVLTAD